MEKRRTETITTQQQLDALCERIRQAGLFAFDTEFIKEDSYEARICLLQVATRDEVAIVDPLANVDARPLWGLIGDEAVKVVVHAGQQDLELAYQVTGNVPRNVYDVQIAAGLTSVHYPLNLEKLVRLTLGARISKAQTRTDWGKRPLSDAQLRYAADDVAYLLDIRDRQQHRLAELGRTEWAGEEFAKLEQPEAYQPKTTEAYLRLKGIMSLNREALSVLRELVRCREDLAAQLNRRPRSIVRDDLLVEIAKHRLDVPEKIRTLRGIHAGKNTIQALSNATKKGMAVPADKRPPLIRRREETPQQKVLLALLSAASQAYCLQHEVAFSLLVNKEDLRKLMESHLDGKDLSEKSTLGRGWRREFIAELLLDLLAGQRSIHVRGDRPDLAVTFE